ncbi:MAG: hypothetical protein DME10_04450 [Candidatus Rokuibacteriota bacterium]|nr:MAG: hypothetical protein DME16_15010 [Candidatus Rokubacteria bacterium]PYM75358.1 MAG: hypothetical protein DME10_04450 [Candidatus Rokubacteria bacterium]
MASPEWKISGDYFEACSCDSVCPCPTSGLAARPTQDYCDAGLVFHVERGSHGTTKLDGLSFAVLLHTPGAMIAGNWTVGVIVDERASAEQREALAAIGSGQGGGPMAALAPLVGHFAGIEAKPIRIESTGMRRSVSIPGALDIAIEGIAGAKQTEPIYLDNVGHPAASRLALAKASRGHMHAFGINWDDTSGKNNGHFAPFSWSSS